MEVLIPYSQVGARGYCATSLSICLRKLGFPNKRDTVKKLSQTAMKASFSIWLARGNKAKTFETVEAVPEVPKVNTTISSTSASNTPQPNNSSTLGDEASSKSRYVREPVGLRNLGQTCYINAIL